MDMSEIGKLGEKIVLCGANAYEQKYYFNPRFSKIPQSVQDELHIICVYPGSGRNFYDRI